MRQELAEGEERTSSDLEHKAKVREVEAWKHFRVFSAVTLGAKSKDLVGTRWVLTWRVVKGGKHSKPDWRTMEIEIRTCEWVMWILPVARAESPPGCKRYPWRHVMKWPLWSLDIKNASLQAGGFYLEVFFRGPRGWNPDVTRHVWQLRAPAYELSDAPLVSVGPCVNTLEFRGIGAERWTSLRSLLV